MLFVSPSRSFIKRSLLFYTSIARISFSVQRSTLHYPHFPHPPSATITSRLVFSHFLCRRSGAQHVFPISAVTHSSPQSDLISPRLMNPPSTAPTVADRVEVRSQGSAVGGRSDKEDGVSDWCARFLCPAALRAGSSGDQLRRVTVVISPALGMRGGYRGLKLDFAVRQKGSNGEVRAHTDADRSYI